mgnify:CR=1 FL=1
MRFTEVFLWMCFAMLINMTATLSLRTFENLNDRRESARLLYESTEFISKSFINTCNGSGFENLNEWQKNCREMFQLEYIAWTRADNFMIDSSEDNGELLYGKWIGKSGGGEVFCRK